GEGKLVLEREHIVEMLRVFLPATTNDARVIDQVDRTITQARNFGFLIQLLGSNGHPGAWEVRRIIKAYVDAETMSDFASRLDTSARAPEPADDCRITLLPRGRLRCPPRSPPHPARGIQLGHVRWPSVDVATRWSYPPVDGR